MTIGALQIAAILFSVKCRNEIEAIHSHHIAEMPNTEFFYGFNNVNPYHAGYILMHYTPQKSLVIKLAGFPLLACIYKQSAKQCEARSAGFTKQDISEFSIVRNNEYASIISTNDFKQNGPHVQLSSGLRSTFLSEASPISILYVCEQQRLWQDCTSSS